MRKPILILAGVLLVSCLICSGQAWAQTRPAKAYNIRMHRSDMPDITDIPSTIGSIIQDGMSDADKAKALWRVVFQHSHQDAPPQEFITSDIHDPIKLFNVYGYRMCCCASNCLEALGKAAGLPTRSILLLDHGVAEFYYDDAWHMFDASYINYYLNDDGVIASAEELCNDSEGLVNPAHCPFFDANGFYPAGTHQLYEALRTYSGDWRVSRWNEWSAGYRCLLTLREGETLVRRCANTGQEHVNNDGEGLEPRCLDMVAGEGHGDYLDDPIPDQPGTFYYFHRDYGGGIIGNGTLTYKPDLAGGGYRRGMEHSENIACTADDLRSPALHMVKRGAGSLVFRMQCPYIFLDGSVAATFKRTTSDDEVKVYISTNNMLDWREIYSAGDIGEFDVNIDIGSYVHRRYSYYLKFQLFSNGSPSDVGIDSLVISNLVQHSQRAMPFLVQGENEIVVDAGEAISTITVAPRLTTAAVSPDMTQNETLTTMHATVENMIVNERSLWDDFSGQSRVTIPVSVPGDFIALHLGGTFRVFDAEDVIEWQISVTSPYSGFSTIHEVRGPVFENVSEYITYTDLPAGTRDVWVRFKTLAVNTTRIIQLRIDADYAEANATRLPFNITHQWTESGVSKEHTAVITTVPHTYTITCTEKPTMTALITSVEHAKLVDIRVPNQVELFQNYPNPFNGQTSVSFYLPRPARVTLTLYDVSGARVRTLVADGFDEGLHKIDWDGSDANGNDVGSGIYLYKLEAAGQTLTRKALYLK